MIMLGGWLLMYGVASSSPYYNYSKQVNWGSESRCIQEAKNHWQEFYWTKYPDDGVQRTFIASCKKNDSLIFRKIVCNEQMECAVW